MYLTSKFEYAGELSVSFRLPLKLNPPLFRPLYDSQSTVRTGAKTDKTADIESIGELGRIDCTSTVERITGQSCRLPITQTCSV